MPRRAIFAKGPYYVEIGAEPEGDHTAILQTWTAALEKIAAGTNDVPAALSWFPSEGQAIAASGAGKRTGHPYIEARLRGAVRISAEAFVVTEASPEAAAAVMQKLRERFGDSPCQSAGRRRCISQMHSR